RLRGMGELPAAMACGRRGARCAEARAAMSVQAVIRAGVRGGRHAEGLEIVLQNHTPRFWLECRRFETVDDNDIWVFNRHRAIPRYRLQADIRHPGHPKTTFLFHRAGLFATLCRRPATRDCNHGGNVRPTRRKGNEIAPKT